MVFSLDSYRREALKRTRDAFRADFPAPVLVGHTIRGGRLKSVSRGAVWPHWTHAKKSMTLVHEFPDGIDDLLEPEMLLDRPLTTRVCLPVRKKERNVEFDPSHVDNRPKGAISLGRFEDSDVVVNDFTISRDHAWLTIDPMLDSYWLVDSGSRNGTWIGGTKLYAGERRSLQSKQHVTFGRLVFQFFSAPDFYDYIGTHSGQTIEQQAQARLA